MSAVIAAEAMRRLPRMRKFGSYPGNLRFGDFRVSFAIESTVPIQGGSKVFFGQLKAAQGLISASDGVMQFCANRRLVFQISIDTASCLFQNVNDLYFPALAIAGGVPTRIGRSKNGLHKSIDAFRLGRFQARTVTFGGRDSRLHGGASSLPGSCHDAAYEGQRN